MLAKQAVKNATLKASQDIALAKKHIKNAKKGADKKKAKLEFKKAEEE